MIFIITSKPIETHKAQLCRLLGISTQPPNSKAKEGGEYITSYRTYGGFLEWYSILHGRLSARIIRTQTKESGEVVYTCAPPTCEWTIPHKDGEAILAEQTT